MFNIAELIYYREQFSVQSFALFGLQSKKQAQKTNSGVKQTMQSVK